MGMPTLLKSWQVGDGREAAIQKSESVTGASTSRRPSRLTLALMDEGHDGRPPTNRRVALETVLALPEAPGLSSGFVLILDRGSK